jgi:antitoxin VapB
MHILRYIDHVYPLDICHVGLLIESNNLSTGEDGMVSVKTKIFKSNRSQAVRLPKEMAFPESAKNVEIIAIGNRRMIIPANESWDEWFNSPRVSEDFMSERIQPEDKCREPL